MSKEVQKKPIIVAQIMGKWVGGGVESVIMNYYRHLDHSKVQFDFICDEDSTRIPYDEIKKLGGRVFLVPKYQNLPKYLKVLEKLFKENQYRIVHSNINTLSVFPLYAAKKAGVPIRISHSHSTSNPKEWKRNLIKNILRPFSKRYATDYFACSELAGRYLFGNKTFDQGEVKIIHNAIDIEKFKFDEVARKKLRKELGIKDSTVVIGHVGRFVQQKNHTFLVDVFNEYHRKKPDSKLLLVGSGPLENEIKKKVERLDLEDSVLFLGQRDDINKLYSVMDVFCLPSLYEGLPVVGVEAQAAGLPCVFSDKITDIIINNNSYLTTIDRPGILLNHLFKINIKRFNSLEKLSNKYNIKNSVKALENEYIRLCNIAGFNITKMLKKDEIRKIQLSILEDIDKFCKKNHIQYFIGYGTMLGAVRHGGYIPWDDDIDICMSRDQYEKFINTFSSSSLSVIRDSSLLYYPFAKVVNNNTYVKMMDTKSNYGLWVDIFPLDKIPRNKITRKIFLQKCVVLRSLLLSGLTDFSTPSKVKHIKVKKFLAFIAKCFGLQRISIRYNKLVKRYTDIESDIVSVLSTPYILKEIIHIKSISNLTRYKFEHLDISGLKDYDSYLKTLYGDYMKIPPLEKRRNHQIIAWEKDRK